MGRDDPSLNSGSPLEDDGTVRRMAVEAGNAASPGFHGTALRARRAPAWLESLWSGSWRTGLLSPGESAPADERRNHAPSASHDDNASNPASGFNASLSGGADAAPQLPSETRRGMAEPAPRSMIITTDQPDYAPGAPQPSP